MELYNWESLRFKQNLSEEYLKWKELKQAQELIDGGEFVTNRSVESLGKGEKTGEGGGRGKDEQEEENIVTLVVRSLECSRA